MVRFETSHKQWAKIAEFLPGRAKDPGRTAFDNRLAWEGLLYVAREGCRWRALPPEFGRWGTLYARLRRWEEQGIFDYLAEVFVARYKVSIVMIDGTIVKVHQDGTGARKCHGGPEAQAIGVSRGGKTTKILAACDENGQVIAHMLLPGNSGESPHAPDLIDEIQADHFIGDKAYDSDRLLKWLNDRDTEPTVPPRRNRVVQRPYDTELYKQRNLIERAFQKMKRYRHIFTRYDKLAKMYRAFIILVLVHLLTRTRGSRLRDVRVMGVSSWQVTEVYVPEGVVRAAEKRATGIGHGRRTAHAE